MNVQIAPDPEFVGSMDGIAGLLRTSRQTVAKFAAMAPAVFARTADGYHLPTIRHWWNNYLVTRRPKDQSPVASKLRTDQIREAVARLDLEISTGTAVARAAVEPAVRRMIDALAERLSGIVRGAFAEHPKGEASVTALEARVCAWLVQTFDEAREIDIPRTLAALAIPPLASVA